MIATTIIMESTLFWLVTPYSWQKDHIGSILWTEMLAEKEPGEAGLKLRLRAVSDLHAVASQQTALFIVKLVVKMQKAYDGFLLGFLLPYRFFFFLCYTQRSLSSITMGVCPCR
jgi:hypothetical protein